MGIKHNKKQTVHVQDYEEFSDMTFGKIKKIAEANYMDISLIEDQFPNDTQLNELITLIEKKIFEIRSAETSEHTDFEGCEQFKECSGILVEESSAFIAGIAPAPMPRETIKLSENRTPRIKASGFRPAPAPENWINPNRKVNVDVSPTLTSVESMKFSDNMQSFENIPMPKSKQHIDGNLIVNIINVTITAVSLVFAIMTSHSPQPDKNIMFVEQRKLELLERMVKIAEEQSNLKGRGTDAEELQLILFKEMLEFIRDSYERPQNITGELQAIASAND